MGFFTAAALLGAAAYGGTKIAQNQAAKKAKSSSTAIQDQQAMNRQAVAEAKAVETTATQQATSAVASKKRSRVRSRSVYTSPLGIGGQANVAKKALLGQ